MYNCIAYHHNQSTIKPFVFSPYEDTHRLYDKHCIIKMVPQNSNCYDHNILNLSSRERTPEKPNKGDQNHISKINQETPITAVIERDHNLKHSFSTPKLDGRYRSALKNSISEESPFSNSQVMKEQENTLKKPEQYPTAKHIQVTITNKNKNDMAELLSHSYISKKDDTQIVSKWINVRQLVGLAHLNSERDREERREEIRENRRKKVIQEISNKNQEVRKRYTSLQKYTNNLLIQPKLPQNNFDQLKILSTQVEANKLRRTQTAVINISEGKAIIKKDNEDFLKVCH